MTAHSASTVERIDLIDGYVDDVVLDPELIEGIHLEDLGCCFWICFDRKDGERIVFTVPLSERRKQRVVHVEGALRREVW